MELKEPSENAPKVGGTFLSVKEVNGNIYIVDQNGEMVNGLISCSAHTNIGDYPTLELTAYSYDLEDKDQSKCCNEAKSEKIDIDDIIEKLEKAFAERGYKFG